MKNKYKFQLWCVEMDRHGNILAGLRNDELLFFET